MTLSIVLPTALPGLITGSMLAIARAAGETAPMLFTVASSTALTVDLNERMNTLPVQIFNDVDSAQRRSSSTARGGPPSCSSCSSFCTTVARLIQHRSRIS